jgi:hypothetical protein
MEARPISVRHLSAWALINAYQPQLEKGQAFEHQHDTSSLVSNIAAETHFQIEMEQIRFRDIVLVLHHIHGRIGHVQSAHCA